MSTEKVVQFKQKGTVIKNNVTHWVCQETGEVIVANEILKPVGRNGFAITYLAEIINLIETLGNKKMQVVKYILANMEMSNNSLIITTRELAEYSNTSLQTVTDTLKALEEAGVIRRRTGAIMINPQLLHRGNQSKEKALITRFYSFEGQQNTKCEDDTITTTQQFL